MVKVAFSRDSYNKCLCGGCPVNRSSACVKDQEAALAPQKDAIEKESLMPDPASMPGIYCSIGKSACQDLDAKKSCLCPACPLQIMEGLDNNYYCTKGSAAEVG